MAKSTYAVYEIGDEQQKRFDKNFTYHSPSGDGPRSQIERYGSIRAEGKALAEHICELTPLSREQSLALTKLEEVVMWANAAIARNEALDDDIPF